MSNRSQSQELGDSADGDDVPPPRTLAEDHLDSALIGYRSRYTKGHEDSIHAIETALYEVVDEMKEDNAGPVAVLLAVKSRLVMHPASASIHAAIVHRCIDRYYK